MTGCTQTNLIYSWGHYEDLVYKMYTKPGKADPGTQIVKLSEDIAKAGAEGAQVPPGVHAHLGYLYTVQGQNDLAASAFATERHLYPESAVFIDGLLARSGLASEPAGRASEAHEAEAPVDEHEVSEASEE